MIATRTYVDRKNSDVYDHVRWEVRKLETEVEVLRQQLKSLAHELGYRVTILRATDSKGVAIKREAK